MLPSEYRVRKSLERYNAPGVYDAESRRNELEFVVKDSAAGRIIEKKVFGSLFEWCSHKYEKLLSADLQRAPFSPSWLLGRDDT